MAISGIGSSFGGIAAGAFAGGVSPTRAATGSSPAPASTDSSSSALAYLENYLKESPAKRMEDAWLAKHNLSEQQLAAMPPAQQKAIRQEMADDIKKKLQEKSGVPGANANVVA